MDKKLQNLEGVYKFLNDTVSVEDFLDAFKKIMKFLDEKRGEDREELNKMSALVAERLVAAMDKIEKEKTRLNDQESKLKQIQKDTLLDLSEKQKQFAELVMSKINSIRIPEDGEDADEEEIANSVYDMLLEKIPSIEDIENDLPKYT
jgi:ABC-type phosphate transport system auxiliary subunit